MKTEYKIVPFTEEHAEIVSRNIRDLDRAELRAAFGQDPLPLLRGLLAAGDGAWTALADGEVLFIYGVRSRTGKLTSIGVPWMLSCKAVENHKMFLARLSKKVMAALAQDFDVLINYVDARYIESLAWVEWLGFTIDPPQRYGVEGRLFHRIIWRG